MKTTLYKKDTRAKKWYVIDASDQVLGRLAVRVANVLRGRHHPTYTPHMDTGDFVVVINADKIVLTGRKEENKKYMFFSGYIGGESYRSVGDFRANKPAFLIEHAVKGMLPRNRLGRQMIKKLKVYGGSEHPHEAQSVEPLPEKF